MHQFVDKMQYQIKSVHHQLMEDENKLNHFLDYVHHLVMLMLQYLTNVHQLVHLIMDNYIQSNFNRLFIRRIYQIKVPDDLFYDEIQRLSNELLMMLRMEEFLLKAYLK